MNLKPRQIDQSLDQEAHLSKSIKKMDLELFNLEPDFDQFVHLAGHVDGVEFVSTTVVKTLLELALTKSTAAFADGSAPPSRVETKLKPDVALAYYNKLPLPNCMNAGTHATFIDNEDYWKRACGSKSSNHEHGYNYKRMYLELNLLEILLAGDDIEDFNQYTITSFSIMDCVCETDSMSISFCTFSPYSHITNKSIAVCQGCCGCVPEDDDVRTIGLLS